MEPGLNDNATPAPWSGRKSGARLTVSLALLLLVTFLACGVAAVAEQPGASRFPAIVIYVGSG